MTDRDMLPQNGVNPERLKAFSDGVFAVIITVLVLDLRPPRDATWEALLAEWPTAVSYAVSYLFVAIVWVNHHYTLGFADSATARLIWVNFAHLFTVSLLPGCAQQPHVQPDPPVRLLLAFVRGGGPVNLVLLGVLVRRRRRRML